MRVLGAVLAGGRSRRFGSDKALAVWEGRTLLDWSLTALARHVDEVVVCGREGGLPDRPRGGLGPLAGLNVALNYCQARGFDAVLSVPCDAPTIDPALLDALRRSDRTAFLDDCPVIGLWPAPLAPTLDVYLRGEDRSLRGWTRRIGAERLASGPIANVNAPADLHRLGRWADRS